MNEGPILKKIPAYEQKICNGCKYLEVRAHLRGHDQKTDHYVCNHPAIPLSQFTFDNIKGKMIHFNHSGDCETPDWCPFLLAKQKPSGE